MPGFLISLIQLALDVGVSCHLAKAPLQGFVVGKVRLPEPTEQALDQLHLLSRRKLPDTLLEVE